MALTLYDWFYGVAQFAAAFLSLIAIVIAISLYRQSWKHHKLLPWRFLLASIVLFAIEEILGALITFGIMNETFLTHVIPSFIMIFLIAALVIQIHEDRIHALVERRRKRA